MRKAKYNDSIFINCPFDDRYKPILNALVFAVHDCGFTVRCTLEEVCSSEVRISKIYNIISDCKYGIHDISRTDLDKNTGLPRFNMPLELGIFFGAKEFGVNKHKKKKCLIIDTEMYRYQEYISDIAGQDINAHNNNPYDVIKVVSNWLRNVSGRSSIPGGTHIINRYKKFEKDLPSLAFFAKLTDETLSVSNLNFYDYSGLLTEWLDQNYS